MKQAYAAKGPVGMRKEMMGAIKDVRLRFGSGGTMSEIGQQEFAEDSETGMRPTEIECEVRKSVFSCGHFKVSVRRHCFQKKKKKGCNIAWNKLFSLCCDSKGMHRDILGVNLSGPTRVNAYHMSTSCLTADGKLILLDLLLLYAATWKRECGNPSKKIMWAQRVLSRMGKICCCIKGGCVYV